MKLKIAYKTLVKIWRDKDKALVKENSESDLKLKLQIRYWLRFGEIRVKPWSKENKAWVI